MHQSGVSTSIVKTFASIFTFTFAFAGCASQTAPPEPPTATTDQTLWQTFEQPEAAEFIYRCQKDYELAKDQFEDLAEGVIPPQKVLDQFNQLEITFDRLASSSSLTRNVHPNAKVREAADLCQQNTAALMSKISLSRPLYNRLLQINAAGLSAVDQRYLNKLREEFERSGVNKDEATRARIEKLNDEIVKIGQAFNTNLREDVRTVEALPSQLDGLPQDYIDAHPPNEQGKVVITTNYPDYLPVMQYAKNDALRLEMYKAFRQRAYPDNVQILKNLLEKRYELAQLIGYDNYAEYVTANKMIGSADNAKAFINKVNTIAKPRSDEDYLVLLARLQEINPAATSVGDWQKTYLEELVKNEVYQVDSQAVRQYFAYDKVRDGIFDLVEELFEVQIIPWHTDTWDSSVETWQIVEGGKLVGQFYLDMHPREGKYKHAAAFGVREGVAGIQTPIAALVCNFPGGDGSSGLMEHTQVETFLHEFGHLLHGLFGGHQPRLSLSGINTEWDFVEAPSQMLEEWVWDADTLKTFARNQQGEVIPDELIEKMRSARDFGRGLWVRHQMFYASLSLAYYNSNPEGMDLDRVMLDLQQQYSPFPYVEGTHFYTSFGHLYGYSAIYYTYMWSLVIAADMFSEFEHNGLRNTAIAQRYRRSVLAPGGTKDAADLVEDFLGRPYNFKAFSELLNSDN